MITDNKYNAINTNYNILLKHFWGKNVINTCYKFWKKFGFLDNMEKQKAEELSVVFDNLMCRIFKGELADLCEKYKNELDLDLEIDIFPMLRMIITEVDNFTIDDCFNFLNTIDLDLINKTIKRGLLLGYLTEEKLDKEAEITYLISNIIINKFNKKIVK